LPFSLKSSGGRALGTAMAFAVAWLFVASNLSQSSGEELFWLTLLYTLCCLPTVLFTAGHRFSIPLMPMWGLGYFSMFGMPLLNKNHPTADFTVFTAPEVIGALSLTVLGAFLLLLVLYTPLGSWAEAFVPNWKLPWNPQRAPRIGLILTLVGIYFYSYRVSSSVASALQQLFFIASQLATIGTLTLFLLQLRGQLSTKLKVFLWGFSLPAQLLLGLGTGAVWEVVRSFSPLLFCYSAERRRIPWKGMLVFAILLIPLLGVKSEYRSYAWDSEDSGVIRITESPFQRGMAFIELTLLRLKEGGVETYTVAAETSQARINHLELLIVLQQMTPSAVPYWKGETYSTLLWALAPRILFPNKPTKTLGNEFGHRYDILSPEDESTSVNLPHQVLEMFINFGAVGVAFGMALLGGFYRLILAFLSHPEAGERATIIGCALLANLLGLDSDFSLVFGGVIYYVLLMLIFTRYLHLEKAPEPA